MTISAAQLKQFLGTRLKPYWAAPSRRAYPGFQDPRYEPLTKELWERLIEDAPESEFVPHVFDCEDLAMQFRVHVAATQRRDHPDLDFPFSVGIAMGNFSWTGPELHVANFAVLSNKTIRWFDMQTGRHYPLSHARQGLRWLLI